MPNSVPMKMKWYETACRYLLAFIYLFGALDGALFLFFDIYMHGKPHSSYVFLVGLQNTRWFWSFLKLIQFLGGVSLLANYKPALGVALLLPVSSVLCLFYLSSMPSFMYHFGAGIIISTLVLLRAYSKSYKPLFADYPW
jgi:putative oxidoreductase